MLKEVFKDNIKGGQVVINPFVVVPYEKFESIFDNVKDNPTYKNMIDINDLGNGEERGYRDFLEQCKQKGILN